MKTRFSHLWQGNKFIIDGVEYTKTNYNRAWNIVDGKKKFIRVKKEKMVEVNEK